MWWKGNPPGWCGKREWMLVIASDLSQSHCRQLKAAKKVGGVSRGKERESGEGNMSAEVWQNKTNLDKLWPKCLCRCLLMYRNLVEITSRTLRDGRHGTLFIGNYGLASKAPQMVGSSLQLNLRIMNIFPAMPELTLNCLLCMLGKKKNKRTFWPFCFFFIFRCLWPTTLRTT